MRDIHHALVLNMHQPPGNLDALLDTNEWEVKEILFAYDRMPRVLWDYQDIARVHLSLSGTLLETLSSPAFQSRVYGTVDCGKLLWHLQNQKLFEILGTGYYHPVLALIPEADWDEHIARWQAIARHLLWRTQFNGFWPPEMGFDMRLIPHLKRAGFRYVMVDCEYVDPVDSMSWQELRYRPHLAEYGGEQIAIVVRDRELSDAQLSGMDYGWFYHELHERTKWCEFPPLVTTATDGDNGGWFRNVSDKSNFWSYFYREAMEEIRAGHSTLRPIFISDYLDRYGAHGQVTVRRGAWNTDEHHGWDFH
ncbi:MAG: glycoside hydrolase family 57, partial [Candidatus Competibacteraceae bacterium]